MVKWSIRGSEQWRGANEALLATFETVLTATAGQVHESIQNGNAAVTTDLKITIHDLELR